MKATDLMIGDWVYSSFYNHPVRITESYQDEYGYGFVKTDEKDDCRRSDASLSPIPLTEEILEKNGFQKEEVYGSLIKKRFKRDWLTIETGGAIYRVIATNFFCTVRYVYQLQHALKHLGFEQKIVL